MHDRKWFTEKGIQLVKKKFTSAKGIFTRNLMEKLCLSKILDYLADEDQSNSTTKYDLSSYEIKSYKFLMEKLKRGLPVPFVLSKDKECLFLISDNKAYYFAFSNHIVALMGLNHFYIKHAKQAEMLLCILKDRIVRKWASLETKVEGSSHYCCTALSNN